MSHVAVVLAKSEHEAREIMDAKFGAGSSQIASFHRSFSYFAADGVISSVDSELGERLVDFTAVADNDDELFVFVAIIP